jgi:hypothetical protein
MISAAPEAYFHDAVADHKDQPVSCGHKDLNAPCVHESHMDCDFDQLVGSAFFQFESLVSTEVSPAILSNVYTFYPELPVKHRHSSVDGRGPPAA